MGQVHTVLASAERKAAVPEVQGATVAGELWAVPGPEAMTAQVGEGCR